MRYIFYLCFIISGLFPIYALQAQDNTICVPNDIKLEKVALWRDTFGEKRRGVVVETL